MQFSEFNLNPELLRGILDSGYTEPTPIQAQTIPLLLENKDVIGCAQTGTGKTAAFAIPLLQRITPGGTNPQALILTPTRELAQQVLQSIEEYGRYLKIKSLAVYGGTATRPQIFQLKLGADIIVATPGRLLDMLQQRVLRLYDIKYFILDEADRMLDMGFIPDIEEILSYIPKQRQTLLYSATMPPEVDRLAKKMTQNPETVVVGNRSATADSVTEWVYQVSLKDKFQLLLDLLQQSQMTSVIIFTKTKLGADRLNSDLCRKGIAAAPIHADLNQAHRQRSLDGFKSGKYTVLVATDIAARGIDVDNVSHVINYDTPTQAEDYVHRIGRTGRAEATGEAFTFVTPPESKYLKQIERLRGHAIPQAEWPGKAAGPKPQTKTSPRNQSTPPSPRPQASPSARPEAPARTRQQEATPRPQTQQKERPRPTKKGKRLEKSPTLFQQVGPDSRRRQKNAKPEQRGKESVPANYLKGINNQAYQHKLGEIEYIEEF